MTTESPYPFDEVFEDALVTMCCRSPKLWSALGREINPELLNNNATKLAMKAARDIAHKAGGEGPSSTVIVIQHLKQWHHTGKTSHEEIIEVVDMFEDAENEGLPTESEIIEETKPILKERLLRTATQTAITQQGKQGDFTDVSKLIDRAGSLGEIKQESMGIIFGDDAFTEIEKIRNLRRMHTGIQELDAEMFGGPENGSLTVAIGGAGDGKSMFLTQVSCEGLLQKLNVAYATLEINRAWTFARHAANISGMTINSILNGSMHRAQEVLKKLSPQMGQLRLDYFTAGATTIDDIKSWVSRIEREDGIRYDVIVVDYGDKLSVHSRDKSTMYVEMLLVFEQFRIWMEEEKRWGFTASQAKRKDKKQKLLTIDDGADSQHKVRVADIIITLNVKKLGGGDKEILLHIAKNRNGVSDIGVGPLPANLDCGRIVELYRSYENPPRGDSQSAQNEMFN
jgi:KaiC/GvpD/RAD55 family RecA-like ATPase